MAVGIIKDPVYWSDQAASEIMISRGEEHVIATGITPSGPIHIGNIREVLTGHAIYRSLQAAGAKVKMIYIADTFDPLRKVYPFLPAEYKQYINWPLYRIPDPEGCCESYADHFLKPFFMALTELGIEPEIHKAHEIAKSGAYSEVVRDAINRRNEIRDILTTVSGRSLPENWFPYQVECKKCHKLQHTRIIDPEIKGNLISYECDECEEKGEADISKGEGKLLWRVDWPARWKALGITVEPFGKDHAAAGGSYDSGVEISRKVFGYEPPFPYIYEWIYLKGQGAMASSTGVAISAEAMLKVVQPEVLRFLILRVRPEKHIDFDPGHGMIKAIDDYQALENDYVRGELEPLEKRIFEMSSIGEAEGLAEEMPISFTHLAVIVQIAHGSVEDTFKILERNGYSLSPTQRNFYESMIGKVFNWLDTFAPEEFKIKISDALPTEAKDMTDGQKALLHSLADIFADNEASPFANGPDESLGERLHQLVYNSGNEAGLKPKESFAAVYLALIGKTSGPRAGFFLASLDKDFVIKRFREV